MNTKVLISILMCLLTSTSIKADDKLALVVEPFSIPVGTAAKTVSMDLISSEEDMYMGFQCDMYLPEGVSWTKNKRGKVQAPTFNVETDRTSSEFHTVNATEQEDGAIRILCYSATNEVILGKEGAVLDLPFEFDENLADGNYVVSIKGIVITTPDQKQTKLPEYKFTITVGNPPITPPEEKPTLKGDINEDGKVDIEDVTALINIILGKNN